MTNFNNTLTYIWTIASASGGISGFDPAKFNLDTSAFQNSLGAGTFALSQSGNDLNLIFTSAAQAVITSVQSGTLASTGNGTNTATLGTAVNPTNAFLIFNTRHNSSAPGGSMLRGRIASSNSVEFIRATTESSTMNIQWYVVVYSAGVRVQRGEVNQTNTTINVPLSPLSAVNQAFVTWSKTPDPAETAFTDSDPVVGEITSTTNLQFRVGAAPSSVPVISWQVIEFQNPASISVQKGSVTAMTGTNLLATVTLGAPVNTNSTFLLAGYRTSGSGTSVGARLLRAQLTDASTVTFGRGISGAPDDISEIAWQAVQINDGSTVQDGSVNFAGGIAETNAMLISLNTNRAAAFSAVQPAGGQNTGRSPSIGNVPGVGSATLAFASASQLTLDRNNTSDQVDLGWQVVGFGPGTLLVPAAGGSAISADTTSNAYTSLTGPIYTEIQNGNVGVGTIILKTPAGFIFNTNTPQPTVLITRVGGSGADSLNINGVTSGTYAAMTTVNKTNLIFTVTSASGGGVTCSLTWTNISVHPTAGTPLASGNLVSLGASAIQGVTTNSTGWGFLAEVVGAATKLAIATQPSSAVTAGVDFPQQPVIQVQDQFGNLRTADNTNVITATSSGTDTNDVNGSVTAVAGVAAFSGMSYLVAQTNTITFSAPGLTSKTSSNIVVSAAAASQVAVVTQPSATATAGIQFAQQPVVQVQDAFGNLRKTDNSTTVTASIDQGSGSLFGTQTFTAVNGVVTFTNLSYQVAETITIDFTASGLDVDTSTGVAVGAAAASQLVIQTQPSAVATAGVLFAQQPVVQVQDQFGNLCATNNITVVTASRNAGSGVLQGGVNITASGGVAAFTNLSHNVATTISVDFNSDVLTSATSSSIFVSPAAVAQLAFATQPGSAAVGSIFGVQPVVVTQDVYGNNSVSGLANSLSVTLALTSGFGALQGATNLDIGVAAGNGTISFIDLEIDSAGSKQLTAGAGGLTSAVSSSFTVAQGSQTITFGSLSNQTYGVAPFAVSAGASSGLPITFSIVSGPASVLSSNVTITGAGTVTVRASQPGDTNYLAATPVDQSFTVGQATLTVSADNKNRIYGATNPVLTASYSGFLNGDTAGVLSGSPALSTAAETNSPVGTYAITAGQGTLNADNYGFSFTNGILTVGQATLTVSVDNTNRIYGTTNPVFTASYSGFVNGDTVGVLSGSPALNTLAETNSPVGMYAITVDQGTLSATNYGFSFTNGVLTVGQATLTVSADNQSRIYGATNPVLTASYSGFLNGDTAGVLSGSPALNTPAETNSPVGTYAITIGQGTLSATNYGFSFTNGALAVSQATLTVSADNQSRIYGVTNPVLTASYSGFLNGDTAGVLSGSPALNTPAETNSPVGTYAITVAQGTLSATNYGFSFTNGVLTVGQAGTSVSVSSSSQTNGYKDSVIFTATLPSDATGSVIFKTNSVLFDTETLSDGSTTTTNSTLPRGTNTITAEYAGDGNYLGSTNSLSGGQVVTNHPPVAAPTNITRTAGLTLRVFLSGLTNNWSDADGDSVTLTGINLVTTNHINLRTNSTQILYTNSPNVNDQITYTISDGQGGTNTAIINVVVNPFVTGQQTLSALTVSNNAITATFYGIPGYSYEVQRSTNLTVGLGWVNIATNSVGTNGVFTVTDGFTDLGGSIPSSAYYRLGWHP